MYQIFVVIAISVSTAQAYVYKPWLRPLYYSDQQYAISNLYGYITNAGGILLGLDTYLDSGAMIGVGLSYVSALQKDINSTTSQVRINHYQGSVFGTYNLYQQSFLDWDLNCGFNNNKNSTYISNTASTTGGYAAQQYSAKAIMHKLYVKKSIHFIPQINANFIYLHQNAYIAHGIGTSNRDIVAKNDGTFMLGAGFKMYSTYTRSRWKIRPELRCLLFYDVFSSSMNALTALVIGGPVISTSTVPGRGSGQFGVSLCGEANKHLRCSLNYDLLLKASYFNNVLSFNIKYLI